METIGEINDLACRSIEMGDYQIALDALNTCLECVKQLKKCQSPACSDSTADNAVVTTKENIERTLRAAKRTISEQLKKHTKGNKRKGNSAPRRSQKRQRQSSIISFPSSTTSMYCGCSTRTMDQEQLCFKHKRCREQEGQHFIYSKPIRLSAFQWTRISVYRHQEDRNTASKQGEHIRRHVELAISANLIFNIALTHHLITSSRTVPIPRLSGDDQDNIDNHDNDIDGLEYTDTLQKKERLRGALRLYEIGFRVHTKRMALVMASQTQFRRRRHPDFSSLSTPSSFPAMGGHERMRQVSVSVNGIRLRRQGMQISRNGELKETTRFALALLNNCAHIHSVLGQHEKAKVSQKRLLSFLLVIIDSGESIHDVIGDDPVLEGYLKNVYDGAVFDQKVAPAAMA